MITTIRKTNRKAMNDSPLEVEVKNHGITQ